jgi:two-component system alkaline phosphatase synthesis response regulator PhoP
MKNTVSQLLTITQDNRAPQSLYADLAQSGFACSVISDNESVEIATLQPIDLVLFETDGRLPDSNIWEIVQTIKQGRPLPVIALIPLESLGSVNGNFDVDDFIALPCSTAELALRIKRLLHRNGNINNNELIECDGLVIDLARCEVTVEGRVAELTFKEYELLKFLAGNKGRVYSRQTLLDKVWGYDYYGGDRTVDVHIRRLRSKIEDSKHTFIDTVRNIGYRFRAE